MSWQALAMRWCWQHQHGNSPEEKDKGPNKGDILNGAASWTILVHYAAGISQRNSLSKSPVAQASFAARAVCSTERIPAPNHHFLQDGRPNAYYTGQIPHPPVAHSFDGRHIPTAAAQQLDYGPPYILRRIPTTILSAAKTSASSTKRARGPITLSSRNVSNPGAAKTGMDNEMRRLMEEEARKIKAIKEQRELRERDRARAEEEQNRRDQEAYNAAIPKSRPPMANQEIAKYSGAPEDNSSSRYITEPPTPGVDRTRQQPVSRGSKSPTTSLHVVRNYSSESHRRDWISDRIGLLEYR